MVTLADIIQHLHPSATFGPGGTVTVSDHGDGPFISQWPESLGKPPTIEELEAHRAAAQAAQPPDIEALIVDLEGIFDSAPFEAQVAFLDAYTVVKRAIRDGKIIHAAAYVNAIPVPTELEAFKAALLNRIQQDV